MALLLHIESATNIGSIALSFNDDLLFHRVLTDEFSHSKQLPVAIDEALQHLNYAPKDLKGISISSGPGSYTGLRIGTSLTKGLCFALGIPLIAVPSLNIIKNGLMFSPMAENIAYFISMIDARRMEVYASVYDSDGRQVEKENAVVIEESSFSKYISQNKKILIGGNGAAKTLDIIKSSNYLLEKDNHLLAKNMIAEAYNKFNNKEFEDLSTFEPFYLKEFQAGAPSKKIANILGL